MEDLEKAVRIAGHLVTRTLKRTSATVIITQAGSAGGSWPQAAVDPGAQEQAYYDAHKADFSSSRSQVRI